MGKKLAVKFLDKFANGTANTNYFVDLPNFTPQQLNALAEFIKAAQTGVKFSGKNKPSNYLPKSGRTVASYNGLRHCHLEPYSHKSNQSDYIYNDNFNGSGGPGIVHYMLRGTDTTPDSIVILAYSPTHKPFPKIDDKLNKLRTRLSFKSSQIIDL